MGLVGLPDEILALQVEWVLLIVAKHLEHDGLGLDVLYERLGDLHRDLYLGRGKLRSTEITSPWGPRLLTWDQRVPYIKTLVMVKSSLYKNTALASQFKPLLHGFMLFFFFFFAPFVRWVYCSDIFRAGILMLPVIF